MQRFSIALDIDDVLAQFYPAMCVKFNKPCQQIDIWDGEGEALFVAQNCHIINDNRRFWMNLEKLSRPQDITFDVDYYITSSPRMMLNTRREWLRGHGFPSAPVISTHEKISEMRRLGVNVLVDDNVKTLDEVVKAGMVGIQFVPPYMRVIREDLHPITHLSQIPSILANLR